MVAEQVGLPTSGRRRVPGLRREEVGVLAAARPARRTSARRKDAQVPPRVQWMLDSITMSAAFVRNGRHDIIAHNAPARTLLAPIFDSRTTAQHGRANIARYVFLDPGARRFFVDWDEATTASAALLRAQAGREPHDRALRDLIGEPSTLSTAFRSQWAAHDGRLHHNGSKRLWHPEVGRLELTYQSLDLPTSNPAVGHHLTIYTAEPGSASEERLKLLTSLAATPSAHPTTQPG
ncbi:transcriptional regulator [Actinomadura sp. SCN-SB]|uniref:MmyB family transcriptional regulator n=1 Tax=Actinomadura sp. SCN-SB TaxID=3373092 RepID=UPI0037521CBC